MTRRLKIRDSFDTKQEYGDCWLYATCTLTSNYYLNMDLELNDSKSIFKDFNDEEKCKVPLYNNFNSFVLHIEDMVKQYNKKKDCRSLIYYYFLFYFIYHIGSVTKAKNIRIGNNIYLFETELLKILASNVNGWKTNFYEKLQNDVSYLSSFYTFSHSTINKIITNIAKMIHNVNISKKLYIENLPKTKFHYLLTDEHIFKRDILEKILSKSYICASYKFYHDPSFPYGTTDYYYKCVEDESKYFALVSVPHVVVLEEVVESKDGDPDNFGIVIKDSNSLCKYVMYNKQMINFHFNSFDYLKSYELDESKSISPEAREVRERSFVLSPPPPPPPPYSEQSPLQPPPPPYSKISPETDVASGKKKKTKTYKKKHIKNKKSHKGKKTR
jgi:hypothetical protein